MMMAARPTRPSLKREAARPMVFASACATLALALACSGDPAAPATGSVEISMTTSGEDFDHSGYDISVDGVNTRRVSTNGTIRIDRVSPGTRGMFVDGLPFNCDLVTTPVLVVTAGQTTSAALHVVCRQFLANAIVYTSAEFGAPELMVMRPDGSRRTRLNPAVTGLSFPAVSPDGRSISVERKTNTTGELLIADARGRNFRHVSWSTARNTTHSWSPDGGRIAFVRSQMGSGPSHHRIWSVNVDGSGLTQLTDTTGPGDAIRDDGMPSWSPDGGSIVFSRSSSAYVMNADGSDLRPLGFGCGGMAWSPDGTRIACGGIFVANSDGTNFVRITTSRDAEDMPSWSPDGSQLVYRRFEEGDKIYRINADGTGNTKLSGGSWYDSGVIWSPVR